MNNENCKMKECIKPMAIGTVAVAVTLFLVEWLVHGVWLMPLYEQTAALWRATNDMGMSPWGIVRLLALGFLITAIFCKCKQAKMAACEAGAKPCPRKMGFCFGTIIGAFMGTMMASSYLWMPVPAELGIKWFIGGLAEGIAAGLVLSHLASRMCKDKPAA